MERLNRYRLMLVMRIFIFISSCFNCCLANKRVKAYIASFRK